MTAPTIVYENNDRAAHSILEYLRASHPSLKDTFSLRPFNRFSTAFTEWWFIARGADWPAYSSSKICVHKFQAPDDDDIMLHTGFYVEKGLGSELLGMQGVKRNLIMESDWDWYRFLQRAEDGSLGQPIRRTIVNSKCPVWVCLDAYEFNKVPEVDSDRQSSSDSILFSTNSLGTNIVLSRPGEKTLSQLNECSNIQELAQQLSAMEDSPYYWINLVIGIHLQYGNEVIGEWGAEEIWHNALEPWSTWIG
jgi:hypothetical protein